MTRHLSLKTDLGFLRYARALNAQRHLAARPGVAVARKLNPHLPGFAADIRRAWAQMSPGKRRLLTEFNMQAKVVRRLADLDASLARRRLPGTEDNKTWAYARALYQPASRRFVLPQEFRHERRDGDYI